MRYDPDGNVASTQRVKKTSKLVGKDTKTSVILSEALALNGGTATAALPPLTTA